MQQIPPPNSLYHSDRSKRLRTALAVLLLLLLAASLIPVLLEGRYARGQRGRLLLRLLYPLRRPERPVPPARHVADCLGELAHLAGELLRHGPHDPHALHLLRAALLLTPVVMLASLLLGTFKLSRTLVCRCSGGDWRDWSCAAAPLLLLSIQFIPSPLNSFYWWNGACYYTFTYGVGLLYLDAFANVLLRPERPRWRLLPGLLCGIFVGGSNYVSALL